MPNINVDSIVGRWSTTWGPPRLEETSAAAWCADRLRETASAGLPLHAGAATLAHEPAAALAFRDVIAISPLSRLPHTSAGAAGLSGWTRCCWSSKAASGRRKSYSEARQR